MKKTTRLQKYHANYVSPRRIEKEVAVTPAAKRIEQRAIAREEKGQYRLAATLWLKCFDAAQSETERARIAIRRHQCITRSNGLRNGEYSGIGCSEVVYD